MPKPIYVNHLKRYTKLITEGRTIHFLVFRALSDKKKKTRAESGSQGDQREEASKDWLWNTDEDLVKEIKERFSETHNEIIKYPEDEEVKQVLEELNNVLNNLREYEKNNENERSLDKAFNAVESASVKMKTIAVMHPQKWEWVTALLGMCIGVTFCWLVLHALFTALWPHKLVYVDLFFMGVFGSIGSSILYLGRRASLISPLDMVTRLGASPFVAIVLVVLLSELTIGIGSGLPSNGVSSDIGALTLRDASIELKLGFAFMFGFFGELSVELLKNLLRQPTTK